MEKKERQAQRRNEELEEKKRLAKIVVCKTTISQAIKMCESAVSNLSATMTILEDAGVSRKDLTGFRNCLQSLKHTSTRIDSERDRIFTELEQG